jgi:SEC-C motif-containing protein
MSVCPCGSNNDYADCCEPLIKGTQSAQTAEGLMRSRYTAHVKSEIDYIYETTLPSQRKNCDRKSIAAWCKKADWQSLEIIEASDGGPDDTKGIIEFVVYYREKGRRIKHHEIAEFEKENDHWYFKDGRAPQQVQAIRQGPKTGRNDPCPCGSGKKYKKCCGA